MLNINKQFILFLTLTLFLACGFESENLALPINCTSQKVKGENQEILNSELLIILPGEYLVKDALNGKQTFIFRYNSYTKWGSPFVTIFKMENKITIEKLKKEPIKDFDEKYLIKYDYQEQTINKKHFVYSFENKRTDDEQFSTMSTVIYFEIKDQVFGAWINYSNPISEIDIEGSCEILNIINTIELLE